MIILSRALYLVPNYAVFGPTGNNPVIGWYNKVTIDNVAADSQDSNFPITNVANPSTYEIWKSLVLTTQYVTFTFDDDEPEELDYVAVARHNFGSGQITTSIEILVGVTWTEVVQETLLGDDAVVLYRFPKQAVSAIRIKMQPTTVPPEMGVIYVGALLVLPRRIYVGHTPFPYSRRTDIENHSSETGNFLGRTIIGESFATSVPIQNIDPAFYRASVDPFVISSSALPFFFSWRPLSYPREVAFAWTKNNPMGANQRSNGMMQFTLDMEGIVE